MAGETKRGRERQAAPRRAGEREGGRAKRVRESGLFQRSEGEGRETSGTVGLKNGPDENRSRQKKKRPKFCLLLIGIDID
jgi:hypothetical protein